jgi:hypothetical protein
VSLLCQAKFKGIEKTDVGEVGLGTAISGIKTMGLNIEELQEEGSVMISVDPWLRNVDEITSATMHHSFRPPLPDLKSQKHQNSLLFLQLL